LEELVGGPTLFEPFFKAHIQKFAGQSITSDDFKTFLLEYFAGDAGISSKLTSFNWSLWFSGRGMPPTIPFYSEKMLIPCQLLAETWAQNGKSNDADQFSAFSPAQKTMFLDILLQEASTIDKKTVQQLDRDYGLSDSKNVEILLKWYLLCIRSNTESVFEGAAKFATQHGRMKYCRPVLRELFKSGECGRKLALKTFDESRSFYHPIAAQLISKDLNLC
jgi:leukotriene-A4 hydrolase